MIEIFLDRSFNAAFKAIKNANFSTKSNSKRLELVKRLDLQ